MKLRDLSARQRQDFCVMYCNPQVYSGRDIAERFGTTVGRIADWAKSMNLPLRSTGDRARWPEEAQ